jgi:hypothetical protein
LYLKSAASLSNAQFSPDGHWVAYSSNQGGQPEIYVQSFPKTEIRIQVSNGGGNFARWRKDGKELFYRALDGRLMSAPVRDTGRRLELGTAAQFGITVPFVGDRFYAYDISADGQRVLSLAPDGSENTPVIALMNWQAALKK